MERILDIYGGLKKNMIDLYFKLNQLHFSDASQKRGGAFRSTKGSFHVVHITGSRAERQGAGQGKTREKA